VSAVPLLPCPFCGRPGERYERKLYRETHFATKCSNKDCPVSLTARGDTQAEADTKWNTREYSEANEQKSREQLVKIEVTMPFDFVGIVNNDLMSRGGTIVATDIRDGKHIIVCEVPLVRAAGYSDMLSDITRKQAVCDIRPIG